MISLSAKPKTNGGLLFWVLLVLFMVIVGPLITIWAVNTLFNLSIPFTFDTWVATIVLGAFFNRTGSK